MIVDLSDKQKTSYERGREREKKIVLMRGVTSSWNKKQIKKYVNNQNSRYPVTDPGMAAILERFVYTNEFQIGVLAEELKEGFDIVRAISRNKKLSFETADLIFDFIKHYKDVIVFYDRQSAQTYYHKLKYDYEKGVQMVKTKMQIEQSLRVKY
jgi:hypothetical protein